MIRDTVPKTAYLRTFVENKREIHFISGAWIRNICCKSSTQSTCAYCGVGVVSGFCQQCGAPIESNNAVRMGIYSLTIGAYLPLGDVLLSLDVGDCGIVTMSFGCDPSKFNPNNILFSFEIKSIIERRFSPIADPTEDMPISYELDVECLFEYRTPSGRFYESS